MPTNWKWKFWSVIAAFVLGIYFLVPTVFNMEDTRVDLESKGMDVPFYIKLFPQKELNLGLDLRGGIYIEMQVELADAIRRKADLFAGELERALNKDGVETISVTQPAGDGFIHVSLNSNTDVDSVMSMVASDFSQVLMKSTITTENGSPTVILTMPDSYKRFLKESTVKQAVSTIRNRIDRFGVAEPSITRQGSNRIAIELPGISDPDRAISIIKKTGQLEFRIVDETLNTPQLEEMIEKAREENSIPDNFSIDTVTKINKALEKKVPAASEISFELVRDNITKKIVRGIPYLISKRAEVTGEMLQNAQVQIQNNEPHVSLTFDKTGTLLFGDVTKNNVKKRLAILLDGTVNKAPVINEPILSGRAQITLGYGDYQMLLNEAEDLALVLQEGALPARMSEATKTVIGPSLGHSSIMAGLKASLIAALLVILFMAFYYKTSGLYADIALGLNIILMLAILSLFGATLTLPGIAGIVLTMGMAVDANILICERIREELRLGKTVKAAVESGDSNALRAVLDSNITTLISGIVLYQFGTGPIKGFAVTLCVGIVTSLFTAIVATRLIYDYKIFKKKVTKIYI